MYPPAEQIALPTAAARRVPVGMPDVAWEHCSAISPFNETIFMPDLPAQQHRRAYCEPVASVFAAFSGSDIHFVLCSCTADAAVTHTDRLIGDVLGRLESLQMSESTAVVVIGDHGYEDALF